MKTLKKLWLETKQQTDMNEKKRSDGYDGYKKYKAMEKWNKQKIFKSKILATALPSNKKNLPEKWYWQWYKNNDICWLLSQYRWIAVSFFLFL